MQNSEVKADIHTTSETRDGYVYQKTSNVYLHQETGIKVLQNTDEFFSIQVPNRTPTDIKGSDAEERAFSVAALFIQQRS